MGPCAVRVPKASLRRTLIRPQLVLGALPTRSPALSSQARRTLTGTALAAVNHWQHHWLCVAVGTKEVQDPHGAVRIQCIATAVALALQVGLLGKRGWFSVEGSKWSFPPFPWPFPSRAGPNPESRIPTVLDSQGSLASQAPFLKKPIFFPPAPHL